MIILKYCVDKVNKEKKVLYVMAVDFTKANDSIKKDTFIKIFLGYKIHLKIIDIVTDQHTHNIIDIVL